MKRNLLLLSAFILACLSSCSDDDRPKLAELNFASTTEQLVLGETKTYAFTYSPKTVDQPEVVWSSSDDKVANVDAAGLVTALTVGKTTIKITNEKLTASFELIVNPIMVTAITFDTEQSEVLVGDDIVLEAKIEPVDATDKSLVWESSDVKIATVEDGTVTGVSVGTAIITVKNNGITTNHTIKVLPVLVNTINIETPSVAVTAGKTHQLVFTVLPSNASDKTLVWKSANEAVATVDQNGLATAIAVGNSEITATSSNGIVGTVQFGVSPIAPPPPPFGN